MTPFAFTALVVCLCLASCSTTPPRSQVTPIPKPEPPLTFDAALHAPYATQGASGIKGQAFLRQRGGGVVTCAGSRVTLTPSTAFFLHLAILDTARRPHPRIEGDLNLMAQVRRETVCDAQGNFSFSGLPAGKWLVSTQVTWIVGNRQQGGLVSKHVETTTQGEAIALITE